MPFGSLSDDQARYRDLVAERTGLAPAVVTAWIAAESGWGATKDGHNYLNIGPGRRYATTEEAAQAVARTLEHDRYADVRAARARGGAAQVAAIASSPWDAGNYGGDGSRLSTVYGQLTGSNSSTSNGDGAEGGSGPGAFSSVWVPGLGWVPNPFGIFSGAIDSAEERVASTAAQVGLWLLLVAAGLALTGFGVVRFLGINQQLRDGAQAVAGAVT